MAYIDDSQKLDLLWKKIQYGVSQTNPGKSAYEELTRSSDQVRASEIWREDNLIPAPATFVPGTSEYFERRCVAEPSVTDNSAWVAVDVYANGITPDNRLRDFISPKFDPSYEIRVYKDSELTSRIFNSAVETNWVFDYSSGILWFPNVDPTNPIEEVYITGWRYVGPKGLNPTFSGSVIDVLTDLSNGSFAGGYVPGWVENQTKISDAIDQLNRALLDFKPKPPATLNEQTILMPGAVVSMDDANVVLSAGFVDNTNNTPFAPTPGQAVEKVMGINLETTYAGPFGNGNEGTLTLKLNNTDTGSVALSTGDNSGVYGKLELNQDTSAGATSTVFYETLIARAVALDLPKGLNSLRIVHSDTGSTNTLWLVRDSSLVKPVINSTSVSEVAGNLYTYSSGIPHLSRGSKLLLGANVDDLATDIHLDTRNVEFQTEPKLAGPNVWAYPGANGLPQTLAKATNYDVTNVVFNVTDYEDNMGHGTVSIKAIARNTNGRVERMDAKKINYIRGGTPTGISPVDEPAVPVVDLGTYESGFDLYARRVLLPTGLTPSTSVVNSGLVVWDPTDTLPAHEAKIVGGVIRASRENYSTYIPAGPDYSSHATAQYITFAIQRKHVSLMHIEIEGRYSNLMVKLPGLTGLNNTSNGWLDASRNYEGWGVPGRDVNLGCAVGDVAFGGSQTVTVTFGTESSSNSIQNLILVRFKLTGTDAITGLRFSGVAR